MRALLVLVLVLVAVVVAGSCRGCVAPPEPINAREIIDTFAQRDAAKVDILWVVDDSGSMGAEQQKLSERFGDFFRELVLSHVDYHIGVVSSDDAEHGVLRSYSGADVDGCAGCRFLTNAVPCPNPDDAGSCQAARVFANLVSTGTSGSSFEDLFAVAAAALGVGDVDDSGAVVAHPPAENAGFVRSDAALYIIFVSDEDDPSGVGVSYYQRLFDGLKGQGGENTVTVAGITGYPASATVPIADVCSVLLNASDPRRADLHQSLVDTNAPVCFDADFPPDDPDAGAYAGGRIIDLACATGGVVADICSGDYGDALDALGADAAGLLRRFIPSTCVSTELNLDCDDDGHTDGDLDGPICVTAAGLPRLHVEPGDTCQPTGERALVPQSATCGWDLDALSGAVIFPGAFVPKPGTDVEIRYGLCP